MRSDSIVAAEGGDATDRNTSTVTKAQKAMNANEMKPNTSKYGTEHGASAEHQPVSMLGHRSSSQWYADITAPMPANTIA